MRTHPRRRLLVHQVFAAELLVHPLLAPPKPFVSEPLVRPPELLDLLVFTSLVSVVLVLLLLDEDPLFPKFSLSLLFLACHSPPLG